MNAIHPYNKRSAKIMRTDGAGAIFTFRCSGQYS